MDRSAQDFTFRGVIALTMLLAQPLYAQNAPAASGSATPAPTATPGAATTATPPPITPSPDATALPADPNAPSTQLAPPITVDPNVAPALANPFLVPTAKPQRKEIPDAMPTNSEVDSKSRQLQDAISEKRIRLLDAVRITLLQETQIKLGAEDVRIAQGALKIASGQFDTHLTGNAGYDLQRAELQESQIAPQVQQRARNKALIKASNIEIQNEQKNLAILRAGGIPQSDTKQDDLTNEFNSLVEQVLAGLITPAQLQQLNSIEQRGNELAIKTTKDAIHTLQVTANNAQKQLDQNPVNSVMKSEVIDYELGIVRQFRNGISVQPFVNYTRNTDNFSAHSGQAPISRSEVGMQINIPLGKNLGLATAAQERSAAYDYEASRLMLEHTTSSSVLTTALAYWDVVAAQERLTLLVRSELISRTLVRLSKLMIDADELPKSDIVQITAREAAVASQRIAAELALINARQELGMAMGLKTDEIIFAPIAADGFPEPVPVEPVRTVPRVWFSEALNRRADRQASLKLEISGKLLVDAAKINLRPRFDVTLRGSYAGLEENPDVGAAWGVYTHNQSGPSVFAGVSLDWPFANSLEKGHVQQSEALYQQNILRTAELSRSIASNVLLTSKILQKSLEQWNKAQEAYDSFQKALDVEREKFKLGNSTLLDSTVVEEQLTSAGLDLISARLQHAQALARLRFETGTLLPANPRSGDTKISTENFVKLPDFNSAVTPIPAPVPVPSAAPSAKPGKPKPNGR